MIRTKLACAALNAIVDRTTNNVSLIDLLEEIPAPTFPIVIPKLVVFWLLERNEDDPQETDGSIVFFSNGVETHRFPVHLNFQGQARLRQMLTFGGYLVTEPGLLRIVFLIGNEQQAVYDLRVKAAPAPQVEGQAG